MAPNLPDDSGSADQSVKLWDLAEGGCVGTLWQSSERFRDRHAVHSLAVAAGEIKGMDKSLRTHLSKHDVPVVEAAGDVDALRGRPDERCRTRMSGRSDALVHRSERGSNEPAGVSRTLDIHNS